MAKLEQNSPKVLNKGPPILLHDNARPHTAKKTIPFKNQLRFEILPHPPYSLDLAPTDYHVFRSLQHSLANKIFNSHEEVENAMEQFMTSKPKEFWTKGIFSLPERWEAVISKHGKYFWLIYVFWVNFFWWFVRGWRSEKLWDILINKGQIRISLTRRDIAYKIGWWACTCANETKNLIILLRNDWHVKTLWKHMEWVFPNLHFDNFLRHAPWIAYRIWGFRSSTQTVLFH